MVAPLLSQFIILFLLFIVFFIGWRVGGRVQDEIVPSRKYLHMGIDLSLLLIISITFLSFGHRALALAVPVVLIIGRRFFPFDYVYAPMSGIILAAVSLLAAEQQIIVVCITLVMNFLIGAMADPKRGGALLKNAVWQPIVGALFLLVLWYAL
jgi:hypothetical protein